MQNDVIRKLLSTNRQLMDLTLRIQVGLRQEIVPTIATSLCLLEARGHLLHGEFTPYCVGVIGINLRCAQNRLNVERLALRFGAELVSQLQIGAAQALGGKSAPKPVVGEIMSEVAAGGRPSLAEVLARLARNGSRPATTGNMAGAERIARILRDQLNEDGLEAVAEFLSAGSPTAVRQAGALLKSGGERQAVLIHDDAISA